MKNNWLSKVSTSAARFAGKAEFTIKKNSTFISITFWFWNKVIIFL